MSWNICWKIGGFPPSKWLNLPTSQGSTTCWPKEPSFRNYGRELVSWICWMWLSSVSMMWMFPKIMAPPNHPFRDLHYKLSILGYPYFWWKHPCCLMHCPVSVVALIQPIHIAGLLASRILTLTKKGLPTLASNWKKHCTLDLREWIAAWVIYWYHHFMCLAASNWVVFIRPKFHHPAQARGICIIPSGKKLFFLRKTCSKQQTLLKMITGAVEM